MRSALLAMIALCAGCAGQPPMDVSPDASRAARASAGPGADVLLAEYARWPAGPAPESAPGDEADLALALRLAAPPTGPQDAQRALQATGRACAQVSAGDRLGLCLLLQRMLGEQTRQAQDLRQQLASQRAEVGRLQARLRAAEAAREDASARASRLRGQLEQARRSGSQLQAQLEELRNIERSLEQRERSRESAGPDGDGPATR